MSNPSERKSPRMAQSSVRSVPDAGRRMAGKASAALDDDERRQGGMQSLGRAFSILEHVAHEREGLSLAELSRRVGLHTSTTFHLVKTMTTLGYLRQVQQTKRYRIGRPVFALAAGALDEIEMVSMAMPILEDLARDSGESSHFAVRMGFSVVIIARTAGPGAFQLTDRVGVVRPAYCTALGKVMLAALPGEQLETFLRQTPLAPLTARTLADPASLRVELDDVRRNRIAFDDGEFDAEVRCAAVPVQDFTGVTIGAIGLSGPVWRLSMQALQRHASLVQAAAARLSAEFGRPAREQETPNAH